LQDGKTKGFHAHASIAMDAVNENILGLSDLILWNRSPHKAPKNRKVAKQTKESFKWHMGATNSNQVLSKAKHVTFVFDREADDFDLFGHIHSHLNRNFVIRAMQNRKVNFGGQIQSMHDCIASLVPQSSYEINLPALNHYSWTAGKRITRKARKATIELRFCTVQVSPPERMKDTAPLTMSVVVAKETTLNLPQNAAPVKWILWTNHSIETVLDAKQIVRYYLLRWNIEQLFRLTKKKGFNQEATELESVDGILKQTTMTFKGAATVMQLVKTRNPEKPIPIEYVFDENQQILLNKVNEHLQGKTDKQKNPFPKNCLSWAAWVIARLGGWKGYQSHKPPGPITMKKGLHKFYIMFQAYQLFDTS